MIKPPRFRVCERCKAENPEWTPEMHRCAEWQGQLPDGFDVFCCQVCGLGIVTPPGAAGRRIAELRYWKLRRGSAT